MAQFSMTFSGHAADTPEGKAAFKKLFYDTVAAEQKLPGWSNDGHGNDNGAFFSNFEAETYYHESDGERSNDLKQAQMDEAKAREEAEPKAAKPPASPPPGTSFGPKSSASSSR